MVGDRTARDIRSFLRWFLRDPATGKLTIVQFPNPPLWVFIIATAIRLVAHPAGWSAAVFSAIGTLALTIWAIVEIGWGVNPFRRLLGTAVLVAEIGMQVASLAH